MDNSKYILEALKMQPLSEEEKTARHILGRLYGPIATCKEKTRNGRGYNRELWERALSDDVFNEKVANKSLFLELGHPLDREETDMEKVCACIPELPKIVNDDLYAYVDILDTRNGRLLKTLCDYGFVPGISSRGSGDIMADDNVDPETFFLETWDIVQLPAVKKARLAMCESMDSKALKLKKVLTESYEQASEEEKKLMKEILDNLDIEIEDREIEDIPFSQDEANLEDETSRLVEANEEEIDTDEIPDASEEETDEEELEDAETEDETSDKDTSEESEETEEDESEIANTVEDFIKELKDYDKKLNLEFKPITIDGIDYSIQGLEFDDSEKDKLIVSLECKDCNSEKSDDIEELPEDENPEVDIEIDADVEPAEETEDVQEDVIDDEADGMIENLKEMVRQKDALETEVKTLKSEKTVGDAKAKDLQEELTKYKVAFERVSVLASKSNEFEKQVKQLTEQLNAKNKTITELETKANSATKLTESLNTNNTKIKVLTEKLTVMQKDHQETENKLNEQLGVYKQKLDERTQIAKNYKAKFQAVLNRYIESKASMLGVKSTEITKRLDEHYTLSDIEKACDEILTSTRSMNNLPFGITNNSKIKINESVKKNNDPAYGYEIDDDLLTLAGLK